MNDGTTREHELETAPGDRLVAACRRKWAELRSGGPAKAARWWSDGESQATRASTRPLDARSTPVPEAPPTRLVRIPAFTENRRAADGEAQL